MGLRAVVDTNVFISIFQFGGRISEILDLALQGRVELFTSQPIIEELRGVLQEKFHWSTERVDDATATLLRFCRGRNCPFLAPAWGVDASDNGAIQ